MATDNSRFTNINPTTTFVPQASMETQQVGMTSASASAVGMGACGSIGIQNGNLTTGSGTAVNFGPIHESNTESHFIGQSGIGTKKTHSEGIAGVYGADKTTTQTVSSEGYHSSEQKNLAIGGNQVFSSHTENNNGCCTASYSCFGASCNIDYCAPCKIGAKGVGFMCSTLGSAAADCCNGFAGCMMDIMDCAGQALCCLCEGLAGLGSN